MTPAPVPVRLDGVVKRYGRRTVLDHVVSLHPLDAVEYCTRRYAESSDPYILSLLAFSLFFAQRFEPASDAAARAVAESTDDDAAA